MRRGDPIRATDSRQPRSRSLTAPSPGIVSARVSRASGDWDLGIIDHQTGATVAGSATAGGRGLAQGFVLEDERLRVQACRRTGGDSFAQLRVRFVAVDTSKARPASLVRVSTPTSADLDRLLGLGLDLTEHGAPGSRTSSSTATAPAMA
jgi:hypothetical protein